MLRQKIRIANRFQQSNFLRLALPRQIVFLFCIQPRDIFLHGWRKWRFREKFGPRCCAHSGHQFVRAESFLVKKTPSSKARIESLIVILIKLLHVNSQVL